MKTVYVGISGGVDSALSAAILKEQGYNVIGAFIKIWQPEFTECTWRDDRLDALRICASLQIPFREIDLSEEYKREVIADMIDNYTKGITPNPDVLCNREIKFGSFARWAFGNGADFVATGHYAQVKNIHSQYQLVRGVDTDKDQSYFLWQLDQKDLARTLFPVGGMTKKQVRQEAERRSLPVARKHDSQGLCFVGNITLPEFLSHYIPLKKGSVLNERGEHIGEHDGAPLYTVGQRHGFTHNQGVPQYISRVDVERNIITVSESIADAHVRSVLISTPHWIGPTPKLPFSRSVQVRYREKPFTSSLSLNNDTLVVSFSESRIASKGQSLVIYDGDTVLGGGIISDVLK